MSLRCVPERGGPGDVVLQPVAAAAGGNVGVETSSLLPPRRRFLHPVPSRPPPASVVRFALARSAMLSP